MRNYNCKLKMSDYNNDLEVEGAAEVLTQVPNIAVEAEDAEADEKTETAASQNHTLGLHDLYKAAFSQEPSTDFNGEIMEEQLLENTNGETKAEDKPRGVVDDSYQLYTMRTIPYIEFRGEEKKITQVAYATELPAAEYHDMAGLLQRPYDQYESEDTNSVLDLDKGIQIQVVKVNSAPLEETQSYQAYPGDTQILHRYLCDSSFLKSDSNDISNPSSGQDETFHFLHRQNNNEIFPEKPVGVSPDTVGVRFEDCDFNSSDSFASTESIIPKNIKCPKCPKKFMFKSDLLRHDKYKHTMKTKLSCRYCDKEFASQQNLIFHEKSHRKKSGNKCEMCKKSFKKVGFLVKHMMKKHSRAPFGCEQCSKEFMTQPLLANHIRKEHDATQPFTCPVCNKWYTRKQGLNVHVKTHKDGVAVRTDEFPFSCDLCNTYFSKYSHLQLHEKSTHGSVQDQQESFGSSPDAAKPKKVEKPFTCDTCFKSFANKSYFRAHMKRHLNKTDHECQVCHKRFFTTSDLSKHERTHTKEKPYTCINCNQTFTQHSNLITHWKKQRCNARTQEIETQTTDLDLVACAAGDLVTTTVDNMNLIVDQGAFSSQQPILLTSIGGFLNSNSMPIILAPNSTLQSYSVSSIPS